MSSLIDGQFPNYDQVIPKKSDKHISFKTEHFMSATKRVALMASDKSNSVKFAFSKTNVVISAITPEIGEAEEEIEVANSGEGMTVAYNARYILDVMKNIGSEQCALELSTPLNPGVFKPQNDPFEYLCVIMPMRI
jgi:DNA polymerase-3 subunit beta